MGNKYLIIGSGRQGAAAAYDLAKKPETEQVILADVILDRAATSCERVNKLTGKSNASPVPLDIKNKNDLISFLRKADAAVSAVPYYNNLEIVQCAIEAGTSMCDLGGNTELVFHELELNDAAIEKEVTIVPDCGMVPGLGTSVCMYAMSLVDQPEEVFLFDGGIPKNPEPPWNYILTFHFEGLINEYSGTTEFLREGKIVIIPCFEEYELIEFPQPIGQLEAFTTAGGTSTAPRTFLGKLKTYQNKTLRYKGHFQQWKTLRDAGLFDEEPVKVGSQKIRPRDLLEAVLNPKIVAKPKEEDICIIRAKCIGLRDGRRVEAIVDLFDYYDHETGFTAMERTTGFHAAMVAAELAAKQVRPGAIPIELAIPGRLIIEGCKQRGMIVTEKISTKSDV
ncbi:MAG TPA: saccharopine dehydrogenase C-terminal domain-containing protein [Acidobacteriota bacterium]|nr:saccharopine dehydrogenase C-terminal domain-containing protein [Acidobacteriota bacterium]